MTEIAQYCTCFDHRYLSRGLALHASMRRHCAPFRLFALCLTDECFRVLSALRLPSVVLLQLGELEAHDRELLAVKESRSLIEYYFTCTPALMAWLLARDPAIEVLTYLDADLYFFASPHFLFAELEPFSTLIVPHNFSARNAALRRYGTYNVGWVSFRRDPDGSACLAWWRRSCIEWCRDEVEGDRFADQKYLDHFQEKFARVRVARHPGINTAPWNLDNYRFSVDAAGAPMVDGAPIVVFHFHRLRRLLRCLWSPQTYEFGVRLDRPMRQALYAPYLAELAAAERRVKSLLCAPAEPLDREGGRSHWRRLRGLAALILRGGGIWTLGGRVL